ncbi:hypothetical protein DL765_001293 [Monosporascus sp. GIB2]|nr:hypothetical protein DL765_001293 [Monosporascus sp. GIB2]
MGSRLEENSKAVRKRIDNHTFSDEAGEEYEGSAFGGFGDYFRRKKIKLQNLDSELRASSSGKPQIFKGVVAHVTGYTQPPLHVLHRELVQHGAGFLQYLDSKTMATHIIASTLPPKKAVDFNKYRIVKPAWVTDSIQAGRLLPWSDYRVIEETPRQKTLKFDGNKISTQSATPESPLAGYREQTENSFYNSQLKKIAEAIDGKHVGDASPSRRGQTEDIYSDGEEAEEPARSSTIVNESHNEPTILSGERAASTGSADSPRDNATSESPTPGPSRAQESGHDHRSSLAAPKAMTSEEHNALLLQDPRMKKSSTANPDFIQQYYSESRLHHLSTWKAELKSRMQRLAAEKGPQAKPVKRKPGARRYVMHVDFDSFFCAVSLKRAPEFVDKPAVVAHGTGAGSEIASCNYPARKHGVKNGMWMKRAKELCPDLKVLPYDFPAYEEASRLFYECILEVGGVVQSVSIDEALVDATSVILSAVASNGSGVDEGSIWREQEKADEIALALRERIKEKTGCAVSVGIGSNILLAKAALRKAKPAGQHQIKPEDVLGTLGDLKVDELPGVAYSIAGKLEEIGVKLVSDIRQTSKERLINTLGPKTGEKLWEYARGIDRTEVGDQPIRKSVSAEVNWGIRFISQEEAEEFVYNLCKELEKRLLNEQVKGKQLTMKIMRRSADAPLDPPKHLGHGKCDTFNKSTSFGVATHDYQVLGKEAVAILRSYKFSPGDLRGLGVQLTKLEPIKTSIVGPDGSQKRLSFGPFRGGGSASAKKSIQDPIQEVSGLEVSNPTPRRSPSEDPIVDGPITPKKPKQSATHPALSIARANEKDSKANTPLNIGGTQFIMPTNPDLAVLAELPGDIRSRLLNQGRSRTPPGPQQQEEQPPAAAAPKSRTESPAPPPPGEIPPEIDSEVFNALPDDVKAEVLASYRQQHEQRRSLTPLAQPSPRKDRQMLMPQSPRKDRVIPPPPPLRKMTPTKPRRGRPSRERRSDANAGIVQTRMFAPPPKAEDPQQRQRQQEDDGIGELDPAFLAELPDDVRQELIADHRRRRAQRSGLDLKLPPSDANNPFNPLRRNQRPRDAAADGDNEERRRTGPLLQFPPRPPHVGFTSCGLTALSEVRDMLNVWHRETADEGPHRRDAEMLEQYLVRVVREERDMDKVVKLVKWLDYLVEEDVEDEMPSQGKEAWRDVVRDVKEAIQKAVRDRGLGPLDMG